MCDACQYLEQTNIFGIKGGEQVLIVFQSKDLCALSP